VRPLRIAFMGSPDFAVPSLEALLDAGHDVVAVYSQPPRARGRGQREQPTPVHAVAAARGIAVRTPRSLRDPAAQAEFAALDLDLAVVAAYGLILPPAILEAPRHGCLNVHASLLPRWRGAAPIQRAILAGDRETGVTIMVMAAGLDTGPMLSRTVVPITGRTTAADLHDALATTGARLLVETLPGHVDGSLVPEAQDDAKATYAAKIDKAEGLIDWSRPAPEIDRQVRALTPWPGTWFEAEGRRYRVLDASPASGREGAAPGTRLDDGLTIACGGGTALAVTRLQPEGRAPMDAAAFLRGHALPDPLPCPATS